MTRSLRHSVFFLRFCCIYGNGDCFLFFSTLLNYTLLTSLDQGLGYLPCLDQHLVVLFVCQRSFQYKPLDNSAHWKHSVLIWISILDWSKIVYNYTKHNRQKHGYLQRKLTTNWNIGCNNRDLYICCWRVSSVKKDPSLLERKRCSRKTRNHKFHFFNP